MTCLHLVIINIEFVSLFTKLSLFLQGSYSNNIDQLSDQIPSGTDEKLIRFHLAIYFQRQIQVSCWEMNMSKKYFDKQNSLEIITSENTCSSDMDGKHTSLFLVDVVLSPTKNRCLIEL